VSLSPLELKRLFALCNNECAFAGCDSPVVDPSYGVVLAEICHIRARSPEGPRFDPGYPAELRDTAENTILLCPTHHTLVDKAVVSFSVEDLVAIKTKHESQPAASFDERLFLKLATEFVPTQPSVQVTSINQSGGQTAAVIHNSFGASRRSFEGDTGSLRAALQAIGPRKVLVYAETSAPDAVGLQQEILQVLRELGWKEIIEGGGIRFPPNEHIVVQVPDEGSQAILDLANVFGAKGWRVHAYKDGKLDHGAELEIRIGQT